MRRFLAFLTMMGAMAVLAGETLNLTFADKEQQIMIAGAPFTVPAGKDGWLTVGQKGHMIPAESLAGANGTLLVKMRQNEPLTRGNRYPVTLCCRSRMRCGIYLSGSLRFHFGNRDSQIYYLPEKEYKYGEESWFAISWNGKRVRFFRDGVMLEEFKQEVPMRNVAWLCLGPYNDNYAAPTPWGDDTQIKQVILHDTELSMEQVAGLCGVVPTPVQERYPGILTVPLFENVNLKVDGELKEDVWPKGASHPVLAQLVKGEDSFKAPAGRFIMAADAENLYLGMRYLMLQRNTVVEGSPRTPGHEPEVWGTESFELYLWIDGTRFRFAGNVAGGSTETKMSRRDWDGPWQYKSTMSMKIDDSRIWEAEAVIPWSTLGLQGPPKSGAKFNFARTWCLQDYSGATSCAYNGTYGKEEFAHELKFATAPTAQLLERNDPTRGRMLLKASIYAPEAGKYTCEVLLVDGKNIAAPSPVFSSIVDLQAGETRELDIDAKITKTAYDYMLFVLRKGDAIYERTMVPFRLIEVYLDAYPRFLGEKILFNVQTELIAGKYGDIKPALTLSSPDGREMMRVPVTGENMEVPFASRTAPAGEYKARLVGADGTVVSELSINFPGLGEWYTAQFPEEVILPPFTPMATTGSRYDMWGRSYIYGNSVFPARIKTQNADFFIAEPEVLVDGAPVPGAGFTPGKSAPHHADFTARAEDGRCEIQASGWVEYDGVSYTKYKVALKESVDHLALRFQMPAAMMKYLHTSRGDSWGAKRTERLNEGRTVVSFYPMVWVGMEDKGLCLFTETRRTWTAPAKEAFIITKQGDKAEILVQIAKGLKAGASLEFEFGFVATPVKPLPADYPMNIFGDRFCMLMRRPGHAPVDAIALCHARASLGGNYFDMDWCKHGEDNLRQNINDVKKAGTRGVQYICGHYLTEEYPEAAAFADEWKMLPEHTLDYEHDGRRFVMYDACPASHANAYIQLKLREILKKIPFDGFYYDFGTIGFCSNKNHGCNDRYPILAQREFYRRTALVIYQSGIKEPLIVLHNTDSVQVPAMTFVSHLFNGEHIRQHSSNLMHDGKDILDTYGLPMFASELSSLPFGITNSVYQANDVLLPQFGGGKEDPELYKFRITQAFLAGCLPHNTIVAQNRCHYGIIEKVVRAYEKFGVPKARFIGYWDEPAKVAGADDIYVSVYRHPSAKKALAVISHIGKEHQCRDVSIAFDQSKLGFVPGRAVDVMQAEDPDYMELYEIQKKNNVPRVRAPLALGDFGSQVESIHDGTLKIKLRWHTFAIVELTP